MAMRAGWRRCGTSSAALARHRRPGRLRVGGQPRRHPRGVDLARRARRHRRPPGRRRRPLRLGRAARRHAAQRRRRADRGPAVHRVHGRPAAAHPPLHLRVRPGGGPRRHRRSWCSSPRPPGSPATRRYAGCCNPADVTYLPAVAAAGVVGFARQRDRGAVPHPRRAADRLRRAGRRRAARPHRRVHLARRAASAPAVWRSAGGGRTRSSVCAITVAILVVLAGAARQVYRRLMDAVDPALVDAVEKALRETDGVLDVGQCPTAVDRPPAARRVRDRRRPTRSASSRRTTIAVRRRAPPHARRTPPGRGPRARGPAVARRRRPSLRRGASPRARGVRSGHGRAAGRRRPAGGAGQPRRLGGRRRWHQSHRRAAQLSRRRSRWSTGWRRLPRRWTTTPTSTSGGGP